MVKDVGTSFATSIFDDRPAAGGYETKSDELLDPETKLDYYRVSALLDRNRQNASELSA